MNWTISLSLAFIAGLLSAKFAQAAAAGAEKSMTVVSFDSDAVLKKINANAGVSIRRAEDGALKVHVTPFEQHQNMWPVVAFGPDYFGKPINLAEYSRLEIVLHHDTPGMSRVDFNLSTSPDASSGVDYEDRMVPGHSPVTVQMDLTQLKSNDPSEVSVLQFIFRPRPEVTEYRVEAIRAVYDPAIGSPAENLMKKVAAAKEAFASVRDTPAKLPADQRDAAQKQISALAARIDKLSRDVAAAKAQQFYKSIRALSSRADEVTNEIGRMRFLGDGPLLLWSPDYYSNMLRETGPELNTPLLKDVSLHMAGNEFRNVVFSATASGQDLKLNVAVKPSQGSTLPAEAIDLFVADYPKNLRGEYTGDALVSVNGPVEIPAGQTRQFWARFNTRTVDVPAGEYAFEIVVSDDAAGAKQTIPGKLQVLAFALPSYDILPNNSYAIFSNGMRGDSTGEIFRQAMGDMKAYGLNHMFVEPPEIPVPTGLDDDWKITGYNDAAFSARVKTAMDAWRQAPGDGKLHFILALSNFEELGLKKEGYAFQNEHWKPVLRQYIEHLKGLLAAAGVENDQWMMVLRDESMEPVLKQYDIPFAEAIKEIDPSIRLSCNSSATLSDPKWTERYFKAFDVFEPHRGRNVVLDYLRKSGRPIWWYECDTAVTALGRDLYDYYRLYTWDMLDQGIVGTGIWTYYSTPHDRPWGEDFQGCQLIYLHPDRGLIHSRRYEMYREAGDDYRYVAALRNAAEKKGGDAKAQAEKLIADAIKDVLANRQDRTRAESWRAKIAEQILAIQ